MGYGVFRRRPLPRRRIGLPWLGVTAAGGNTLLDDVLVHYTMDEEAGNDRLDSIGALDLDEASTSGSVGQTASGKIDGAADFDASDAQRLIRPSHDASLAMDSTRMAAFWVRLDTVASGTGIIAGMHNAGVSGSSWRVYRSTAAIVFRLTDGTGTKELSVGSLSADTWYAVIVYHDTSDDTLGISVTPDSESALSAFTTDSVGLTPIEGNAVLAFGAASAGGSPLDGKADEFAMWAAIKSEADLEAWFNGGDGLAVAEWGTSGAVTFTATVTAVVGGAAAAATADHEVPTFSATSASTAGGAASAATATHEAPTFSATLAATTGGAASDADAAFDSGTYSAAIASTPGGAAATATAAHEAPTFSAATACTSGGAASAIEAISGFGTYTAAVTSITGGAAAAATAGSEPPTFSATLATQTGGVAVAVFAGYDSGTFTAAVSSVTGGAAAALTAESDPPTFTATMACTVGGARASGQAQPLGLILLGYRTLEHAGIRAREWPGFRVLERAP